jgi:hypothetical protein
MTANREAGEGEDPDARIWLIIKDGYYYRANRSGYTKDISSAGRYTRAEADREAAIEPWHMSVERQPEPSPDAAAVHLTRCHDALRAAREVIAEDRRSLIETISINGDPTTIDPMDVGATAEYDATLALIDEVLK